MCKYLLILAACCSIKAADTKKIETPLESFTKQIAFQEELMTDALERSQDSRDALDKTMYMKEYLMRKDVLKDLQEQLALQSKQEVTKP